MFRKALSSLYKVYFFLLFASSLILLYPVFYVLLAGKNKNFTATFKWKQIWAKILFYGSFNRLKVDGKTTFSSPSIICPNHSSYIDIVVCYLVFKEPFLFIGKAELLKWPLFNIFFKHMDIPIERSSPMQAAKAMVKARQALRDGYSLIIFPEGTISPIAPKLKPFKNGAIKLAVESNCPIVPVTFVGNHQIINVNSPAGKSGPNVVEAYIHNSISTQGLNKPISDVSSDLKNTIASKLPWK